MRPTVFRLTHRYDIGDQSIYFQLNQHCQLCEPVFDLAGYIQYKSESMFNDSVVLDSQTVFGFFALFGATEFQGGLESSYETIDMYYAREHGGDEAWFERLDKKYGEIAEKFLAAEARSNLLHCELDELPDFLIT